MKVRSPKDLHGIRQEYVKKLYRPDGTRVNIGMATCGIAAGAKASLEKATREFSQGSGMQICQTGCLGFCEEEPLVEIVGRDRPRVVYRLITEDKILGAIQGYVHGDFNEQWILGQMRDPRSLLEDEIENPLAEVEPLDGIPFLDDLPFYHNQIKVALRNCGYIDPDSIEEYSAGGGYRAFLRSLSEMQPAEVISIIKKSGLRERGGGGFPTGVKWETCARQNGQRYVICNADEGDPGAYMDRSILEGDPTVSLREC